VILFERLNAEKSAKDPPPLCYYFLTGFFSMLLDLVYAPKWPMASTLFISYYPLL